MAKDFTGEGQMSQATRKELAEAAAKRQRAQYIDALERELHGYEVRGLEDRAENVRAVLADLGADIPAPAAPEEPEMTEEPEVVEPKRTATTRGGKQRRG